MLKPARAVVEVCPAPRTGPQLGRSPPALRPGCPRSKDLAAAIWRPELGLAEVVLQRGRLLTHMGFTKGPKLYLFIEEAV